MERYYEWARQHIEELLEPLAACCLLCALWTRTEMLVDRVAAVESSTVAANSVISPDAERVVDARAGAERTMLL